MTELEQKLMDGLTALNEQHKAEMSNLNKQIQGLSEKVESLSKSNNELMKSYNKVAELLNEELNG